MQLRSQRDVNSQRIPEFIRLFEQADQNKWVVQWWLEDFYMQMKRYADCVRAAERMLAIAPDDPRSSYVAAGAYRVLTHAQWTHPALAPGWPGMLEVIRRSGGDPSDIDPSASQVALDQLGMSVEDAYDRSIELHERTLRFKLLPRDRGMVQQRIEMDRGATGRMLQILR